MAMANLPSQLRDLNFLHALDSQLDIVLIPGIATLSVEQWGLCTSPWLELLGVLRTRSRLLAYDPNIALEPGFEWQNLLDEGARLLTNLVELCYSDDSDTPPRPVILVCHSLGGLVAKQALSIANVRAIQHPKYRQFVNCIAGIVFISCPHGLEALQDRAIAIVKQFSEEKISKQHMMQLQTEASKLADVVGRFQNVNLRVDILTLYERLPTKSKRGWRSKSFLIVDRDLAETKAPLELCVGLKADHSTICALCQPDGKPHPEVRVWLTTVIDNAIPNIEERLKAYALRNPPSNATSVRSEVSIGGLRQAAAALEITPDDVNWSGKAQDGSSSMFERNMNTIFENFSTARTEANLPCFVVDTFTQNDDFYGREELLGELDAALLPGMDLIASSEPGKMNHVILCGMAGMGKTEVAIQYVYTRRSNFDAIFWIRAEDNDKLVADFGQIAATLGLLDPNEPYNPVVSRDIAKGWLSNPKRLLTERDDAEGQASATWLLVFDNADDPDLLQDYIQIFGKGSILITTREPDGKNFHASSPVVIQVTPFDDNDSAAFLSHMTRANSQPEKCSQIATLLGGLPLALAQMAGVMRKQYLDYSEFLEMYEDISERADIHDMDMGISRQTARGTISSIWAIDKLSDQARTLLEIFAFLDSERIQENIVVNKAVESIPELTKIPTQRSKFLRARGELLHQSLIRRNEEKKELWMHRVLQDVVKAQLAKKEYSELIAAFKNALILVQAAWPIPPAEKRHSVARWPKCEALFPHVVELAAFFDEHLDPDTADEKLKLSLVTLLHEAGWWQYERGSFSSAHSLGEKARKLCTGLDLTSNKHIISRNHDLLGCVANGSNNPKESMRNNTRLLALRKEIAQQTGKEDVLLAYAHNQMGCSLMMANEYEKATPYFEQALEIWRRLPEFRPGLPSMEYSNLGLALWLQGKLEEASAVLERGQREREEGFGYMDNESFRAGRILYALGNVRFSQGHIQESEAFHQRALLQFQSTIGNTYHRTADVCHKISQHCLRRGSVTSLEKARKLVDQALTTWASDTKGFANEIARTTFLKSLIVENLGEESEARRLRDDALRRRRLLSPGELTSSDDRLVSEKDFDELVTFWSR